MKYSITETRKNQISENLAQASIIIASIPDVIINDEMRERISFLLYVTQENINFLDNLKVTEELDMREFHQMD